MNSSPLKKHKSSIKKRNNRLIGLLFVTLGCFLLSLMIGSSEIGLKGFFKGLFFLKEDFYARIVWSIRMPRTLAALLCGLGLGAVGCVMQGVLSNPMASPSTLGVSNAAIFGANLAIIVLGGGSFAGSTTIVISSPYLVTATAFVFALLWALLFLLLSLSRGASNQTVVLAGLAGGTVFSSATTLVQFFAVDTQISAALFWSFGDLGRASYPEILILSICMVAALVFFIFNRWGYNGLAQGGDVAHTLGIRVNAVRISTLAIGALVVAVSVSFFGVIGFIGLMAPHVVKLFIKDDFGFTVPASAMVGSVILLVADLASRTLFKGVALPVGAITSLLGGPVFLWLLLKREGKK